MGRKSFGTKHQIVGDLGKNKNGWLYDVWGSSSDPNTWFEQNKSVTNGKIRPMRRTIVKKS